MKKIEAKNKNLTSFADHLDEQYGKRGSEKRESYEQEFEAFKLDVFIQEMREEQNLIRNNLQQNAARQNHNTPKK